MTKKYLRAQFRSLLTNNRLVVRSLGTAKPWVTDVNHWNFEAGKAATKVSHESS